MNRKVIITAKVHPYLPERLTQSGYQIQEAPQIRYEELEKEIKELERNEKKLVADIKKMAKQNQMVIRLYSMLLYCYKMNNDTK